MCSGIIDERAGEVRAALAKRLEELEPGAGLVIGVDRSHVF